MTFTFLLSIAIASVAPRRRHRSLRSARVTGQWAGQIAGHLASLLAGLTLLLIGPWPAAANAAASAAESAAAAAAVPAPPTASAEATLRVFNREVFTFRATALGMTAAARVERAKERIEQQLSTHGEHPVTLKPNPLGTIVMIDDALVFFVTEQDVDVLRQETVAMAAERAAAALREVIAATRESRSFDAVLRAVAISAAATAVAAALLWLLRRIRLVTTAWLMRFSTHQAERLRVSGVELIRGDRLAWATRVFAMAAYALLVALLLYAWAGLVLAQFPYTRVWGVNLNRYLIDLFVGIGTGIADAVPGLFTAAVIFLIARLVAGLMDGFFARASQGPDYPSWLDPDLARPTRRIAKGALWLFAFAMAYPYLPGAHTDAVKGLSVLLGLMLSIGSSNLVGQGGSGLILTYARVFRPGEYVRIADHEGTVTDLGMFVTRLRTGLGEEVTLSNTAVLGAVTKNYSRAVKGAGFVLDTTLTIGYDTPWRQVDAMLVEAALRTPGVLADPAPRVFQTSLSDFYPEYRLVCQAIPDAPRPRAQVLSALHANIQDIFNEHGVQIMSPHYVLDPKEAKLVPKANWFAAPARADD